MNYYTRHYIDENDTYWSDAMNYLAHCPKDDENKIFLFLNEMNRVKYLFLIEDENARKSI